MPSRWSAGQRQRLMPAHVSEGVRRAGVGAGAVFLGLEHDVDLAAPRDGRFEVGGDLGEGVGGVADQQDSLAGSGEQFVEDGGGQPLFAD